MAKTETEVKMKAVPNLEPATEREPSAEELREQMREARQRLADHKVQLNNELKVLRLEHEHMKLTVDMARFKLEYNNYAKQLNEIEWAARDRMANKTAKDENVSDTNVKG